MKTKSIVYTKPQFNGNITSVLFNGCTGTTVTPGFNVLSFDELNERIDYDVGRRKTNRCYHLRETSSRNRLPVWGTAAAANGLGCKALETISSAGSIFRGPNSWSGLLPTIQSGDANWRSYSSQAVQAMWPEVESRLSTGNFILELPELRDIPRFLPDLIRLAKSKKGTLKKIVSGLSGSTLFSEFSLRPLLSDILGFHQAFQNARNDVKRILDNEYKPLVSHYRKKLELTPSHISSAVTYSDSNGSTLEQREWSVEEAWYTATMRYSYRLLDYQRKEAYDLGLWDALGLNLNPSIIWNALPWSFVVDWFARVGNFLEQTKIRNLEPIVSVDGFCHSYKAKFLYVHSAQMRYNRPANSGMTQTGTYRQSIYMREPYVPDTYTAIQLSGANTREFVLGGSLIGVRR